jgi:hypothetical protein
MDMTNNKQQTAVDKATDDYFKLSHSRLKNEQQKEYERELFIAGANCMIRIINKTQTEMTNETKQITANELKIGNFVEIDQYPDYKIINQIEEGIDIDQCVKLNASPIPITEEWLLKLGFTSNPYQDRYEKGQLHIECDKTKGEICLWIESMPHIKHVHQLQNLYFALTGEELTYGGNK